MKRGKFYQENFPEQQKHRVVLIKKKKMALNCVMMVSGAKTLPNPRSLGEAESTTSQSVSLSDGGTAIPKNKKWLSRHRRELADRDHILLELKPIIRKLKHFPSDAELKMLRRSDIAHSILEEHGGFVNFQISLGFTPRKKTGGMSLYDKKNFLIEFEEFKRSLGHFPTKREFFKEGRGDLYAASRFHGGLDKLRTEMGIKPSQLRGKNSLRIFENYSREIGSVRQQLGHFPSWDELVALKRLDLLNAARYHGGMTGVRKRMQVGLLQRIGEDSLRNKKVFDNELAEYLNSKGGELPSWKQIAKENGRLARAITKYHGGMNKLRASLGMELRCRTGPYSLSIPSNFFKEFDRICAILGHFPSDDELSKYGIYPYTSDFGGLSKLKIRYHNDQIETLLLQGSSSKEIARRFGLRNKLIKEKRTMLFSPGNLPALISAMHQNNFSVQKITKRMGRNAKTIFLDAKNGNEGAFDLLLALYKPIITKIASSRFVANSSINDKINYLTAALFEIVKRRKELPRKKELIWLLNDEMKAMVREEAVGWISLDRRINNDNGSDRLIDFVDTGSKIRLRSLRRK